MMTNKGLVNSSKEDSPAPIVRKLINVGPVVPTVKNNPTKAIFNQAEGLLGKGRCCTRTPMTIIPPAITNLIPAKISGGAYANPSFPTAKVLPINAVAITAPTYHRDIMLSCDVFDINNRLRR